MSDSGDYSEIFEDFFPLDHRHGALRCQEALEGTNASVADPLDRLDSSWYISKADEKLKRLVKTYGIEKIRRVCQMAVENGKFKASQVLPSAPRQYEPRRFPEDHSITLRPPIHEYAKAKVMWEFKLLRELNLCGAPGGVKLFGSLDKLPLSDLIETIRHYNQLRVDRMDESKKYEHRWGTLTIKESIQDSEASRAFMLEPALCLFRGIAFEFYSPYFERYFAYFPNGAAEISLDPAQKDLLEALQVWFLQRDMNSLLFANCRLTNQSMRVVRNLMNSLCLNKLSLSGVFFEDPARSSHVITKAMQFQARATEVGSPVFLEKLYLSMLRKNQCNWTPADVTRIVSALVGNAHLKELGMCFQNSRDCIPTLQVLARDLLPHTSCHLKSIHITIYSRLEAMVEDEDEIPHRPFSIACDEIWLALFKNTSLRTVEIVYPLGTVMHFKDQLLLFIFAFSPKNTILSFKVRWHFWNYPSPQSVAQFLLAEFRSQMDVDEGSTCGEPDQNEAIYHQCIIRGFHMQSREKAYLSSKDLGALLFVVKTRLPYLYNVGLFTDRSRYLSRDNILHPEDRKSPAVVQQLDEIALWLERNQVGRALLHWSVVERVPLGLWPVVLAKAANSQSILSTPRGRRPPLDGLYYMVQGLLLGGPLASEVDSSGRMERCPAKAK